MDNPELKRVETNYNVFIYISDKFRVKFDKKRSLYSKGELQELRIVKSFWVFNKSEWVTLSYHYESMFVNNIDRMIKELYKEAGRAFGGTN